MADNIKPAAEFDFANARIAAGLEQAFKDLGLTYKVEGTITPLLSPGVKGQVDYVVQVEKKLALAANLISETSVSGPWDGPVYLTFKQSAKGEARFSVSKSSTVSVALKLDATDTVTPSADSPSVLKTTATLSQKWDGKWVIHKKSDTEGEISFKPSFESTESVPLGTTKPKLTLSETAKVGVSLPLPGTPLVLEPSIGPQAKFSYDGSRFRYEGIKPAVGLTAKWKFD